jgi:hypothetical protein
MAWSRNALEATARWRAAPLEANDVVHTARRARPSVGKRLDGEVPLERDPLDHVRASGLRQGRLLRPAYLGALGSQKLLDVVEEFSASRLADFEQPQLSARDLGPRKPGPRAPISELRPMVLRTGPMTFAAALRDVLIESAR